MKKIIFKIATYSVLNSSLFLTRLADLLPNIVIFAANEAIYLSFIDKKDLFKHQELVFNLAFQISMDSLFYDSYEVIFIDTILIFLSYFSSYSFSSDL